MQLEIIKNNYCVISGFISPEEAAFLNKQFIEHCAKFNLSGDSQVPNSQAMYNFLPFVRLLVKKTPYVSEIFGEDLMPTYTYGRVYKNGAVLKRHRDRAACEVSITLNISKDTNWPIYIQRPDGSEVSIELNPGDAALYLGCQADHWRNEFTGNNLVQVFLHYVKANGDKAWAFFDREKQPDPTPPTDKIPVSIL